MDATNSSSGRIVRWEILKGLPGEGPVPHHFHSDRPTPWSEGIVVRFWNQDGTEWVGNFQGFGDADVLLWPEANAVAVIAGGAFYLIDGDDPNLYTGLGPQSIVNGMMFDEHRQILVVVADYRAHAFDVHRRLLWTKGPGWCINRIVSVAGTVMTVEVEDESGRLMKTVDISTAEESVDDRRYLNRLVKVLAAHPEVERLDPGLSIVQIQGIERQFKFRFPSDFRGLLQFVVPIGKHFPNWRGDQDELQKHFDLPFEGIWFDIEHNGFWLPKCGAMPSDPQARREAVRHAISEAPRLIPIFSHRYIPAEPNKSGNPVFSVHQTDVIHYGKDLADYFHREFQVPLPDWAAREPRPVRFWDDALGWRD